MATHMHMIAHITDEHHDDVLHQRSARMGIAISSAISDDHIADEVGCGTCASMGTRSLGGNRSSDHIMDDHHTKIGNIRIPGVATLPTDDDDHGGGNEFDLLILRIGGIKHTSRMMMVMKVANW